MHRNCIYDLLYTDTNIFN